MLQFFSLSSLRVPGMHLIVLPGPDRSHSHPQAMDSDKESERSDWSGLGHAPFLDLGDEGQPHLNYLHTEQRRHNFQRKKKIKVIYRKGKARKTVNGHSVCPVGSQRLYTAHCRDLGHTYLHLKAASITFQNLGKW